MRVRVRMRIGGHVVVVVGPLAAVSTLAFFGLVSRLRARERDKGTRGG